MKVENLYMINIIEDSNEMRNFKFFIAKGEAGGKEEYFYLFDWEVQIEYALRGMGYENGPEKEKKRLELIKKVDKIWEDEGSVYNCYVNSNMEVG